jgi:hypothetical protein
MLANLSPNGSINVIVTSNNANHHMEENLDFPSMLLHQAMHITTWKKKKKI